MITAEESRVLSYLRRRLTARADDLMRDCLPGSSRDLLNRVLSNLEWFGHVVVYNDRLGNPSDVQITEKGMGSARTGPAGLAFQPL